MLTLAAYAGLRPGEIAGLDWSDLREQDGGTFLRVRSSRTGGHERRVQLDPVVVRALKGYEVGSSGPMFLGLEGRPIDPKSVSRVGNRFLARHGFEVTMDDLRRHYLDHRHTPTRYRPTVNDLGLLLRR